jgi:hypothetical protein
MQKRIRIESGESMNEMLKKIRRGESSESGSSSSSTGSIRSQLKHKKYLNTKFDAPLPVIAKKRAHSSESEPSIKIRKT